MPKKSRKPKKNSLKIGIIFSAIILFFIALSMFGKGISLLGQGKYDDNYPLSVKVEGKGGTQFLSVFPKQHKINILNISGVNDSKSLEVIPVDARVVAPSLQVNPADLSSFFLSLKNKDVKTNLTVVDIARLYIFSKTVGQGDVSVQSISLLGDSSADKIIFSLFSDPAIIFENLRVEIVNATGVYGKGNKVARLLSNIGANIVFVSTADKNAKQSLIYYTNSKTYTVERLERLLGFKSVKNNQKSISDILVLIGEESLK